MIEKRKATAENTMPRIIIKSRGLPKALWEFLFSVVQQNRVVFIFDKVQNRIEGFQYKKPCKFI